MYEKIGTLVDLINEAKAVPINAELLKARLSKWIDEHVFAVHQRYIDDKKANKNVLLGRYAADDRIAFDEVIRIVEGDGYSDVLSYEEIASRVRLYYCAYLNERKLYAISHKWIYHRITTISRKISGTYPTYPLNVLNDEINSCST